LGLNPGDGCKTGLAGQSLGSPHSLQLGDVTRTRMKGGGVEGREARWDGQDEVCGERQGQVASV
jgi:hypothetical protein